MEYSSNDEENFQIGINKLAKKLNAFNILGKIKKTIISKKTQKKTTIICKQHKKTTILGNIKKTIIIPLAFQRRSQSSSIIDSPSGTSFSSSQDQSSSSTQY